MFVVKQVQRETALVQRWKQDEDRVLQAEQFWILTRVRLIKHTVTTRVGLRTSSHRVLFPSGSWSDIWMFSEKLLSAKLFLERNFQPPSCQINETKQLMRHQDVSSHVSHHRGESFRWGVRTLFQPCFWRDVSSRVCLFQDICSDVCCDKPKCFWWDVGTCQPAFYQINRIRDIRTFVVAWKPNFLIRHQGSPVVLYLTGDIHCGVGTLPVFFAVSRLFATCLTDICTFWFSWRNRMFLMRFWDISTFLM